MISDLLGLAAANLLFLIAGLGITAVFGRWGSPRQALSYLPVAYVAGVAGIGICIQLVLIAGWPVSVAPIGVLCFALGALTFTRRPTPHRTNTKEVEPAWPLRAVQITLGALFVLLLIECSLQALDTWDSFAIWTLKARAIASLGGLKPEVFASHAYAAANLDYPLLLPGLQGVDFGFMRSADAQVIHIQSWLLLVGWLLATARMLKGRADSLVVWPMLGLAAAAPATITLIQEGYADIPAAIFGALAALSGWLYLVERDSGSAGLLAIFAAASAATKREAWTFALALLIVTFVAAWRRNRPLVPLVAGFAVVVLIVVSWLAWLAHYGYTSHEDLPLGKSLRPTFLFGRLDRVMHAIVSLADYSVRPSLWLAVVPITVVVIALAYRRPSKDVACFLTAVLALDYAALVWAFWISRENVNWHLQHAAPRVVATPVFVAATFVPLLTGRIISGDEQRTAPRQL